MVGWLKTKTKNVAEGEKDESDLNALRRWQWL
jgi:hypothetical protein